MNKVLTFFESTVGQKVLMALTGIGLIGFVVGHMVGNLQFFGGPEPINAYAKMLKSMPAALWAARIGLLGLVFLHIVVGVRLKLRNKKARPQGYAYEQTVQASTSSRYMIVSGIVLLSFIVYHIAHFTLGVTHPDHYALHDNMGRHDVYGMIAMGFQNPYIAWGYVGAMALLCCHLSHGVSSLFQTLGFNNPKYTGLIKKAGIGLAVILFLGFSAVPLSVQFGFAN